VKTHVGRFEIAEEPEELARIAASLIVDAARARPKVGIFLAGGTTPKRAYELTTAIATAQDFAGVHLWLGDERVVPIEDPESNAGMILRVWGDALGYIEDHGGGVRMPSARFHVMPGQRGVDRQIRDVEWALAEHAGTTSPRPDFTLLGVGADGHTASLFPGDPALEATGLYASARGGTRITATRRLLTASRKLVFLAVSGAKADAIAAITADPTSRPAGRVALEAKTAGAEVTWLLDRAAVAKIA
jgi:6-phosphogluconolactonase